MYQINGDITFDDYAIEIDEDYIHEDYDIAEQNQYESCSENTTEDTDVQFE